MMVLMRVAGLSHGLGRHDPVLVLEAATGTSRLGLVMPMNEANRLARVLGLTRCRCTPVYGLIDRLVWHLAASVTSAVLDACPDGIHATLVLDRQGDPVTLPCHPADAIALALRSSAPIYATPRALAHGGPPGHPDRRATGSPDVAAWLEQVSPSDFAAEPEDEQ